MVDGEGLGRGGWWLNWRAGVFGTLTRSATSLGGTLIRLATFERRRPVCLGRIEPLFADAAVLAVADEDFVVAVGPRPGKTAWVAIRGVFNRVMLDEGFFGSRCHAAELDFAGRSGAIDEFGGEWRTGDGPQGELFERGKGADFTHPQVIQPGR
jgi:hypothetical protein